MAFVADPKHIKASSIIIDDKVVVVAIVSGPPLSKPRMYKFNFEQGLSRKITHDHLFTIDLYGYTNIEKSYLHDVEIAQIWEGCKAGLTFEEVMEYKKEREYKWAIMEINPAELEKVRHGILGAPLKEIIIAKDISIDQEELQAFVDIGGYVTDGVVNEFLVDNNDLDGHCYHVRRRGFNG